MAQRKTKAALRKQRVEKAKSIQDKLGGPISLAELKAAVVCEIKKRGIREIKVWEIRGKKWELCEGSAFVYHSYREDGPILKDRVAMTPSATKWYAEFMQEHED